MLKKTMTYIDFNGESRTEDFYFNLTKAELAEMNLSTEGGLDKLIERITNTKDVPRIVEYFKRVICASYGRKSPDGRRFIKNAEVLEDFTSTQAFSDLYMELIADEQAAADFIKGILPPVDSGKAG